MTSKVSLNEPVVSSPKRRWAAWALPILSLSLVVTGLSAALSFAEGSTGKDESVWQTIWFDDFDGNMIDPNKWVHEVNCWGGGNGELQCYTSRPENSYVKDSLLHIVARQETYTGLDGPFGEGPYKTLPFTSARLHTKHPGDFKYGRFCARAKLPAGQGLWPAFWMLPRHFVYGMWAASGEIDIMEAINLPLDPAQATEVHGSLYHGGPWPFHQRTGAIHKFQPHDHPAYTFHNYCLIWDDDAVHWMVDGEHYASQTAAQWSGNRGKDGNQAGHAPFDQAFFMLLNVAVGGQWPGPPHEGTRFPQEMLVDWVQVDQCRIDRKKPSRCLGHL